MGRKIQSWGRDRPGTETDGRRKLEHKVRLGAGKECQKNLCLTGKKNPAAFSKNVFVK